MPGLILDFFILMWLVIAFAVLRWAARYLFREPHRATLSAAAVVVAFAAGMAVQHLIQGEAPPPPAQAVEATYAAPPDVMTRCRSARFTGAVKGLGNVDGFGQIVAGRQSSGTDGFTANRKGTLWISGWAVDVRERVPAEAACMTIDGKIEAHASAQYGAERIDVANHFQADATAPSGFFLTLPADELRRGPHRVGVAVVLASGETDALPTNWTITVR